MIASATTNAAAPVGAAAPFSPLDTAGGLDAFAALLDGLAAASQDATAPAAALGGINVGVEAIGFQSNICVEARSRKGQLPVELPSDGTDASAESRAADQQAADAGLALLLASLTMPAPIQPSDPPDGQATATLPSAGSAGDTLESTSVESEAPEANAPGVDIAQFASDKTTPAGQSLPAAPAAVEAQVVEIDRTGDERERLRVLTPPSSYRATRTVPQTAVDSGVPVQLTDAAPADTVAEVPRELTGAAPGRKLPVQQRFSTDAIDAPASAPVSRDDKPVKSFGQAAAGDAPEAPGAEATPADVVAAASAPSNLSSGSGRDNSPASSSQSRSAVEASMAAPDRAVRSAQAFARAMDVHMAAIATPGTTNHVQPSMGVVNATAAAVPEDLSTQIVQAVRMQWSDGVGDARITLKPEYLGDVTITLHVDQGSVTAVLHADSPAVRSWLQANEPLLGQALSEQGLKLERLVVSEQPPTEDGGAPDDDTPRQQEQPRRRRQRPDAAGFEIIL